MHDSAYAAAIEFALNCKGDPLGSREAVIERLRELESWGVDLSLVRTSLDLTPEQRLERNAEFAEFALNVRILRRKS